MRVIDRIKEAAKECNATESGYSKDQQIEKHDFHCANRGRLVQFKGVAEQILISFRKESNMSLSVKDDAIKQGYFLTVSEVVK